MDKFKFTETDIHGVYVIEVKTYEDERGYFMETYNEKSFQKNGLDYKFVQDNQSSSTRGVLRGLHFQRNYPQAKLVRVLRGEVFDVAVDLRESSATYGKWVGVNLSDSNKRQLLIPRGFAHGFLVVSEYAEFTYKCDQFYYPDDEGGIIYNDPDLAIQWPSLDKYILSEKDRKLPTLFGSKMVFKSEGL